MSVIEWVPRQEGLKEICELLTEYQKPSANHAQIYKKIEEYSAQPEFSNYLAYLLALGNNFSSEVRQCAGLMLKNRLRSTVGPLPEENLKYIHATALQALTLPAPSLRQTAGTVVAVLVCSTGLPQQIAIIRHLAQTLTSSDSTPKEGALDALHKICEDGPTVFEGVIAEERDMATQLVTLIVQHFFDDSIAIRRLALAILNIMIGHISSSQETLIQQYREGLFRLNVDPDPRIRKEVCYGMTQLISFHQAFMEPYLKDVIHFMLDCTKHKEVSIVMESCEFWMAFVDANLEPRELQPLLGELLPILLNNMVYEDDDEAVVLAREAEEAREKPDSELRPFIAGENGSSSLEADEDLCQTWTLRKCSAAGLDKLSTLFGNELLHHALPLIQQKSRSHDWKQRECAILILGAISSGCESGLEPHLSEVLTELLARAADPDPLVRIISCWALSRYGERVIGRAHGVETGQAEVTSLFETILKSLHDTNTQVQLAACSALASIEEIAGAAVLPFLKSILEHLAEACRQYSRRNLRMAYDAIGILAERAGAHLAAIQHRNIIMPALLALYNKLGDDDSELQPLFACLCMLAAALGDAFEDYTVPIFARCIRILTVQLEAIKAAELGSGPSVTGESFIVSALDLISGLMEGLGVKMEPLVRQSNLPQLVYYCCQSKDADIRQSGFALLGELAKTCPSHLQPLVSQFCALAVDHFSHQMLAENALSACNNACWALGELSLRCTQPQLQPIALKILENCVNILMHARCLPRSFGENAAITLGRVSMQCAAEFAPHLSVYVGVWCEMLRDIRDDVEKEQAFTGLFNTIALNPDAAAPCFPSICAAVASWVRGMPDGLKVLIRGVMQRLRQLLERNGEWESVMAHVAPAIQAKLENFDRW